MNFNETVIIEGGKRELEVLKLYKMSDVYAQIGDRELQIKASEHYISGRILKGVSRYEFVGSTSTNENPYIDSDITLFDVLMKVHKDRSEVQGLISSQKAINISAFVLGLMLITFAVHVSAII